jgi:hypothetical protein
LGVAHLEGDVAEPFRVAEGAGSLDHLRGDVDPQRAPGRSHTGRIPRRLTCSTANIEDVVLGADAVRATENSVVQPQLSVVIDEPILATHSEYVMPRAGSETDPARLIVTVAWAITDFVRIDSPATRTPFTVDLYRRADPGSAPLGPAHTTLAARFLPLFPSLERFCRSQ